MSKDSTHYVNNKQLYGAMCMYIAACREAQECDDPRPRVPEYIGLCISKIANRYATKPQFSSYTYRDEMIGDGIETCIRYLHNFDPDKSDNPFAYFSQIIYNAFIQRITKEKKQALAKAKLYRNAAVFNGLVDTEYSDHFGHSQHAFDIDDDKIAVLEEAVKPASKRKKNKK